MKNFFQFETALPWSLFSSLAMVGFLALRVRAEKVLRGKIIPKGLPRRDTRPGAEIPMQLTSSAFANEQPIPRKYTCDGEDINPPLNISGVPAEAQSLTLIVHDPDAPMPGGWTHWTLFNIAPDLTEIKENSAPEGVVQAMTNFGRPGYGGPCPPSGTHHYHFRLYALDTRLALGSAATKDEIEHEMEGHVLAATVLTGLYSYQEARD